MALTRKTWLRFILLAAIGIVLWIYLSYPQIAFVNLSVGRTRAYAIAEDYLSRERGVDPSTYTHAITFSQDTSSDRYLQKALGFQKEISFLKDNALEMFFWQNRFFRENQKEEYHITVSAATGEITDFSHTIEETAARPQQTQEEAEPKVVTFLKKRFGFDPARYILLDQSSRKYDNRVNYTFIWRKKIEPVSWSPKAGSGTAKLTTGATISGDEILGFYKNDLKIPEDYVRYLQRQTNIGSNLSVLFRILFFTILISAIFFVIVRRNNLVMHTVKRFCIGMTFLLFFLNLLAHLNHYQGILMSYPTTRPFASYIWQYLMNLWMNIFIITVGILMPVLAGESIHYEELQENRQGSFLHYVRSTFLSRNVAGLVVLGYLVAIIMFGIQSLAFALGQKFLGVWVEYSWMSNLSESYFPFLTALTVGLNASLTEEITYRMFCISMGKKFFKNLTAAVIVASVIWGYGHSGYPVFPMWFRGLEVTALGLLLAHVYLRYGILPVIVAHYLFDVFWISSSFLLGHATPTLFTSSLATLLLPLLWAGVAFGVNRPETERPLRWNLNKHQIYNLKILKDFLTRQRWFPGRPEPDIRDEIVSHGWDMAVVEIALEDLRKGHHDGPGS